MGMALYVPELGDEPLTAHEMLDDEPPPAWVTHLVLRGTYLPGTVRCTAGDRFRPPPYLSNEFVYTANSRAFKCYVDVRANAYVLGNGPSTLTAMVFKYLYFDGEYRPQAEKGRTEQDVIEEVRQQFETSVSDFFPGKENFIFIGPPVDLSSEVWRLLGLWDVQRQDDGTVVAVHPERDLWRRLRPDDYQTHLSKLEMELATFTQAVTTANQARVTEYGGRIGEDTSLPMLVTNANQLSSYFREVGAYDDPDNPPAQPPPPCGLAVPDQSNNPGLMRDCTSLLAMKDTLRGSAFLNWSVGTAIDRWDGVTVADTPKRVTILDLSSRSLTGTIPAMLSRLTGLLDLRLASNSLTGPIPTQLADLPNLETLYLSGNSLTGCIPVALEEVSTNDLSSLNLLYCQPPAQEALAGTAGESSVALSWNSVSNASGYRVEYRLPSPADWSLFSDALTGTSHTVSGQVMPMGMTYKQTEPSPPLTFLSCPSPAPLIRCNQPTNDRPHRKRYPRPTPQA